MFANFFFRYFDYYLVNIILIIYLKNGRGFSYANA
jgi:hypothetical protein